MRISNQRPSQKPINKNTKKGKSPSKMPLKKVSKVSPKKIKVPQKANDESSKALKQYLEAREAYLEYLNKPTEKIKLKNAPKTPIIQPIPGKGAQVQKSSPKPKVIKRKSKKPIIKKIVKPQPVVHVAPPEYVSSHDHAPEVYPSLTEQDISRQRSPSNLINSVWREIEKYPNVSIIANGAFSFVIAKTLTLNVKIVLDKSIFQPYEKIETNSYCVLMVLYVPGREDDDFEFLLRNLMKVGCPFHKLVSLEKTKKLLAEES